MIVLCGRRSMCLMAMALCALFSAAGCGVVRDGDLSRARALPLVLPPGSLAADFDRPSSELVPLIEEEAEPREQPDVASAAAIPVDPRGARLAPPGGRSGRYGVRAGQLATRGSDKTTWAPMGFLGAYYRNDRFWKDWFGYELGLDIAGISGDSGDGGTVAGTASFLRVDALFGRWRTGTRAPAFYGLFGLASGSERATWEPTGEIAQNSAGVVELGIGVSGADGSWDARLAYLVYIGSENALGAAIVGMGVSF